LVEPRVSEGIVGDPGNYQSGLRFLWPMNAGAKIDRIASRERGDAVYFRSGVYIHVNNAKYSPNTLHYVLMESISPTDS